MISGRIDELVEECAAGGWMRGSEGAVVPHVVLACAGRGRTEAWSVRY